MKDFMSLGLSEEMLAAIERKGFSKPTEIQSLAIPLLMNDEKDIIAQAQTGTGKTAVFAIPLMEKLDPQVQGVQAIVLAPTRELAIQVEEEIRSYQTNGGIRSAAIYGGQGIEVQLRKLKKGVSIVVGTPGRILDHIRRGTLQLDSIRYFILDEADEMLNMGFIEDIETILDETPQKKRVLLFSATMPGRIRKLAEKYMGEYDHVKAEPELTTDLTEQIYFEVRRKDKTQALTRILEIEEDFYGIVFCKTKADVDELNTALIEKGFRADNLHGDISQPLRERILGKFRTGKINILVATDVAARGIDVGDLTHVINYSIPQNPESYIHRIGRTGRAGKKGTAITFVTPTEFRKMNFIKKFTNADIRKEKIPDERDILDIKKKKLVTDIERMIGDNEAETYREMARELLAESSSEDLISALLRHTLGKEMDDRETVHFRRKVTPEGKREENKSGRRTYRDRKVEEKVNVPPGNQGEKRMTRLSIALGKADGITGGKITSLIRERAGTKPHLIRDMIINEDHTLINVPAKEAKSILKFFRRTKKGKLPLITKEKSGIKAHRKQEEPRRFAKKKGRFVRD
jgi:ATP-dependent RNA helicase DeaD